jgi:hypothetical protein
VGAEHRPGEVVPEATDADRARSIHEARAPLLGTWPRFYAVILGVLAAQIVLYALIAARYR